MISFTVLRGIKIFDGLHLGVIHVLLQKTYPSHNPLQAKLASNEGIRSVCYHRRQRSEKSVKQEPSLSYNNSIVNRCVFISTTLTAE